jgi:predicted KAP-like P-loop ATPase
VTTLFRELRHDNQPFGQEILLRLKEDCPAGKWFECERLVKELFPQLGSTNPSFENDEWVRDGRICDPLFYDTFFQLDIPRGQISQSELAAFLNQVNQGLDFAQALHHLVKKNTFPETLRRLECNQEKIERERIPDLLAAIWNEEENSVSKNWLDGDPFDRDACKGFTRGVVCYKVLPEKRADVIISALNKSRTISPAARFWYTEYLGRKENSNDRGLLLTQESLDRLKIAVAERLQKSVDEGLLIQNPELHSLLYIWPNLTTNEERKAWLKEQLLKDDSLVLILKGLINQGSSGEKKVYYISRKTLEDLIPTYVSLKDRLHGLQRQQLSRWEAFAVDQTLERIKEEEDGLPERDYWL